MEMVRVLDRSHKTIKDYWHSSNILKGININTAWEVVSKKCLKEVWHKCLPQFMHDFTGFEPVVNNIDDINRISQEAGLDKVIAEDITELLDTHRQQHSNDDLEEMVEERAKPTEGGGERKRRTASSKMYENK